MKPIIHTRHVLVYEKSNNLTNGPTLLSYCVGGCHWYQTGDLFTVMGKWAEHLDDVEKAEA